MTTLSFLNNLLGLLNLSQGIVAYVPVLALAFIIVAAIRMTKKLSPQKLSIVLFVGSVLISSLVSSAWKFPLLLVAGACLALLLESQVLKWQSISGKINYTYFWIFVGLTLVLSLTAGMHFNFLLDLWEKFYRYGYLVIGGGQVVIPMMQTELIDQHHYLTVDEFLTGYGLVQGLPGPMFSFAAYAGGMALRSNGAGLQFFGGLISGLAIFVPGYLLILFVYPIWQKIRQIESVQVIIKGMIPVATGFVISAAINLLTQIQWDWFNVFLLIIIIACLYLKKVPAPILVILVLGLGGMMTLIFP